MIHGGNVWQGKGPKEWLDYSANIRPEGAPQWVKDALTAGLQNVSYYPDTQMKEAKEKLAEYLEIPAHQVCPTAGGISAIDMATHLDTTGMILCTPCFAEYEMQSRNRNLPVKKVSLLKEKHQMGNPAKQIREKLFEGCTVWLCNPLNPVGTAFSNQEIMELLEETENVHGWLVVDEAFIDYCPEYSVVKMIEKHERLLVTGSMTKILGIPGARVGYLCAQEHILNKLSQYQLTWELNCFAQSVVCALPEHREDILKDSENNAKRREKMCAELEKLGLFVYPSHAAFVLADFMRPVDEIMIQLKKQGILVRSCMNFDGLSDGCHLRLAVKDENSNKRLLSELEKILKSKE